MATRNLSIRLSVKDAEIVRRALEGLGEDGQRALGRLDTASRKASRGTLALNDAMGEVRGTAQGYAAQLGPLGAGLTALGPAGLAAAAGIGAAVLGLGAAIRQAKDAIDTMSEIVDAADKIGVSTEALQEWRFVATQSGVSVETLDSSIEQFVRRLGEAREGTGSLVSSLKDSHAALLAQVQAAGSTDEALALVIDAMAGIEDAADRAVIAQAAFGRAGVEMGLVAGAGADQIDKMRKAAHELGIVINDDVLRGAEEAGDKLDALSQVIEANLNVALVNLAPLLVSAASGVAELARVANAAFERMRALGQSVDQMDLKTLTSRADRYRKDIAALSREGVFAADDLSAETLAGVGFDESGGGNALNLLTPGGRKRLAERLTKELEATDAEIRRRDAAAAEAPAGPLQVEINKAPPPSPAPAPKRTGGTARAPSEDIIDLRPRTPPIPMPKGMTQEMVEADQRAFEAGQRGIAKYDEQMARLGETLTREVMTPAEQLNDRLRQLNDALAAGVISQETFSRQVAKAWDDLGRATETTAEQTSRAQDVARELGLSFESAFENAIVNGAAFSDVLRGIEQDLIRIAARELVTKPLLNEIGGLFGGLFGGGQQAVPWRNPDTGQVVTSGGGGFSLGGLFANLFHDGGRVGGPAPLRLMPTETFRDAPRLHSGGGIGLRSDEMPAILQRGEIVLPRGSRPAKDDRRAPVSVVMNITTPDVDGFRQSQTQIAAAMQRALSRGQRNM